MTAFRPIATATIEPLGSAASVPRDHAIKLVIQLGPGFADKEVAIAMARRAFSGFAPASGRPDQRYFGEVAVTSKHGKLTTTVIGVEAKVLWPDRPSDELVESLRAVLLGDGYRVSVRGKRECVEAGCMNEATIEWNRPAVVPTGWYSSVICGRHNYRACARCQSVYLLTSANSPGQAPSVQCQVCGVVLVEWGGTKLWHAELITRGACAT